MFRYVCSVTCVPHTSCATFCAAAGQRRIVEPSRVPPQVPGAGTYDPAAPGSQPKEDQDEQPSSAFASSVQRFAKSAPVTVNKGKKVVVDRVPPPWKYDVKSQNKWDQPASDNRTYDNFGSKVGPQSAMTKGACMHAWPLVVLGREE